MSRIDVVPSDKGKFAVLINLGSDGRFEYSSVILANEIAREFKHDSYPQFDLNLYEEEKK